MKTTMIARCVFAGAAIFAAAGLIGCGAEQGSESEIGQTSAALSSAALASLSTATPDMRARGSVSCAFEDSGDLYHAKIGGFNSSGATAKIQLAKNGGAWAEQSQTLSVARGQSEVFQIDGQHCAVIGGGTVLDGGGTAQQTVDIVSLNTGTNPVSVTVTAATHGLAVARQLFKLSSCTDNNGATHILAISGLGTRSVEVSPTLANLASGTWASSANILRDSRIDFGVDTDASNHYFVAGGIQSSTAPNPTNKVELFSVTTGSGTCTPVAVSATPLTNGTTSVATTGNVVFYDATNSVFVVMSGKTVTPTLWTNGDKFAPNFAVSPPTIPAAPTALGTVIGQYRPSFARISTNTVALLGGADAAVSASLDTIQKYASGTVTSTTTGGAGVYLGSASYFSAANKVDLISGDSTPGTFGTAAFVVTP